MASIQPQITQSRMASSRNVHKRRVYDSISSAGAVQNWVFLAKTTSRANNTQKKNQQKPKTKSPSKRLGHVRKNLLNFRIRGGRNKCQEQTLTYIIICSNALFFSRPIFFNIDI